MSSSSSIPKGIVSQMQQKLWGPDVKTTKKPQTSKKNSEAIGGHRASSPPVGSLTKQQAPQVSQKAAKVLGEEVNAPPKARKLLGLGAQGKRSVKAEKNSSDSVKKQSKSVKKAIGDFFKGIGKAISKGLKRMDKAIQDRKLESEMKLKKETLSEENIAKINEAYKNGDYKKANSMLAKVAKFDPQKAGEILQDAEISLKDIDDAIEDFTKRIKTPEKLADVVIGATRKDIEHHTDSGNLLRGNSAASKLLKAYTNEYIAPAFARSEELKELLNSVPEKNLLKTDEKGNIIHPKEFTEEGMRHIQEFSIRFFDMSSKVMSENKDTPAFQNFHRIAHAASDMGNTKFGAPSGSTVAGNFLFLRGLSAMILTPELQGVKGVEYKGAQRDNVVQFSKVVTNLANNTTAGFNKEEHLKPLLNFATSTGFPKAEEIRRQIITPPETQ